MSSKVFARLIVAGVALLSLFLCWRNAQRQRLSEALLGAVTNYRVADMKALLLRGADVHLPVTRSGTSDFKETPIARTFDNLLLLCEAAPPAEVDDAVCLMLKQDGRDSYRDETGGRYLRAVCGAGCVRAARLLLNKGADPLQADDGGETALNAAARSRLNITTYSPVTSFHAGRTAAQERLLNAQRLAACDQTLQVLLARGLRLSVIQAVNSGNVALLRNALSASGSPVSADQLNRALYEAVRSGELDAVKLLLAQGANINTTLFGSMGTLLSQPVVYRHKDVVRYLLAQGADFHRSGVMETAVSANDPALVKDLLRWGASPDPVRPDYPTRRARKPARPLPPYTSPNAPLNVAARAAPDCVEPLLQAGADLRRAGPDILATAIDNGHEAVVPTLVRAGAHLHIGRVLGTPALLPAVGKAPHLIGLLLDNGADPNIYDSQARTPLGLAAQRDDLAAASLLLAHGANVDFQSPRGHNALHHARKSRHAAMVALLERAGAKEDR